MRENFKESKAGFVFAQEGFFLQRFCLLQQFSLAIFFFFFFICSKKMSPARKTHIFNV